jgi:hypothetical protein
VKNDSGIHETSSQGKKRKRCQPLVAGHTGLDIIALFHDFNFSSGIAGCPDYLEPWIWKNASFFLSPVFQPAVFLIWFKNGY